MSELLNDLRYGVRTLRRSPGYTLFVVLTLGLGIGANTAIFSVITGVLLKPLPYAESDRLLLIRQSAPLAGQANVGVSIKEYFTYREQAQAFEALVEYHQMSFDLLKRGEPDRVTTAVVSHNFFDVLGIRPLHGRTFVAADDVRGAEAVLVLSHSYWKSRFSGDPAIVGQVFEMNGRPHTVIGVLPNVPMYPQQDDVYMPVLACPFRAAAERNIAQNARAFSALNVFGRLRPGVAPERAAKDVEAICGRFVREDTRVYRTGTGFTGTARDVRDELTTNAKPMLLILMGTTGLVLLLACANVANLTLARLLGRSRELAVRAALGAGRLRLVRQLLTESLLVAVAGGAVGLAFAWATLGLLTSFTERFTTRTQDVALDPWVLVFTLALSLVSGVLFGTAPATAPRSDVAGSLKQSGKGQASSAPRGRLQSTLVVTQVAVSVVLLVGAGLLLVSFVRLQRVDPGYRADRVLSAEIFGNFRKYPDAERLLALYVPLLDRLQALPGVESAAITNAVPLSTIRPGSVPFEIRGRAVDDPARRPTTDVRVASPRFFDTVGIPLLQGRVFTELDHAEAPPVVLINQSMVRYWDGADPVGSEVSFDRGENWARVVGVVGNARLFGLTDDAPAQVYGPMRQMQGGLAGRVLVRTAGDPNQIAGAVQAAIRSLDPDLPIENVRTLDDLRDRYLATPLLTASLLSVFAGLALVVTLAGLTGVLATSVSHRTQEFGVRMALGARRGQVLQMVLGQGLTLVAIGVAVGIAGSLALGRVLSAYLYATTPADPAALAIVAVTFAVAGTLACLGPAWRATTVDPMIALRGD